MMIEVAKTLIKYCLLIIAAYLIYLVYNIIVKPYLLWRKFKQYPNVLTSPSFIPFLGDFKGHIDSMNKGKVHYAHIVDAANETKEYDLWAKFEGVLLHICMISNKSVEEFCKLQGTKIDKAKTGRGISGLI